MRRHERALHGSLQAALSEIEITEQMMMARDVGDLRVVFASGYDIGIASMGTEVRARSAALQKPYSEQELGAALKSVMEKQT
jgi:hypothetical protein